MWIIRNGLQHIRMALRGFPKGYCMFIYGVNGQQSPLYQLGEPGEQSPGGPPPTKT